MMPLSLDDAQGNSLRSMPRTGPACMYNVKSFLSRGQFIHCQEGLPLKCAQTPTWYVETTNWDHLLNLSYTGLNENRQNPDTAQGTGCTFTTADLSSMKHKGRAIPVCCKQNGITYTTCIPELKWPVWREKKKVKCKQFSFFFFFPSLSQHSQVKMAGVQSLSLILHGNYKASVANKDL